MKSNSLLKYQQFSDFLLEEIRKGVFKPGEKLPSERELGKYYNLAHMTVNKALNGLVTTGYLKRVQGYGTFVEDKTTIKNACLILNFKNDIHALFPAPMQQALSNAGYIITTFDSQVISESPTLLKAYLSQSPDLLLFDAWFHFPFELLKYVPPTTRQIAFNRYEIEPKSNISYILMDAEYCGYMATKQLIAVGKQQICILGTASKGEYRQINDFKRGCDKALTENGMTCKQYFDHDYITNDEIISILQGEGRCDGIITAYDTQAIPVIKMARELGISIPEELALIGRNNTPWSEFYKLSSIDILPQLIAQNINTVLESDTNVKIMVKPKLVLRQSCPKVKDATLKLSRHKEIYLDKTVQIRKKSLAVAT